MKQLTFNDKILMIHIEMNSFFNIFSFHFPGNGFHSEHGKGCIDTLINARNDDPAADCADREFRAGGAAGFTDQIVDVIADGGHT